MALHAEKGDRFWTLLDRVSSSGSVLANSPYSTDHIHISLESVQQEVPIDLSEQHGNSRPDNLEEAAYVEVKKVKSGTVYTKAVSRSEWPNNCPLNIPGREFEVTFEVSLEDIFQTGREEPVEWEGTEQNALDEEVRKREKTFNESDVRGSKNDLLDGHL